MSTIILEAEPRADVGRGASRRLRRLENKVLAVVYGSGKEAESIHLAQNKVFKALENEAIYSSVFTLKIGTKKENVILKALQRHPYKPIILHMDLQRVSDKDVLVKQIPLHFINEELAPGINEGGVISHSMTQVEVRCQAQYLPAYIEVDMANVNLNDVIHLSDLKLAKNVELTIDVTDHIHNLPVVSIHLPKVIVEEVIEEVVEGEEALTEGETAEAASESGAEAASGENPEASKEASSENDGH